MQARAIFEAACDVKKAGVDVKPEVMIPLVGFLTEFNAPGSHRPRARPTRSSPNKASQVEYLVGTMIEVPRAAVCARPDRQAAEFFSFGTNDLTQTGARHEPRRLRRAFIDYYRENDIIPNDPFQTIDQDGVGGLMQSRRRRRSARRARRLKLGICGEHGGDPARSCSATASASTTSGARRPRAAGRLVSRPPGGRRRRAAKK